MDAPWRWMTKEPGWFAAFTDERAGNLAQHVEDDPQRVADNRQQVQQAAGATEVVYLNQIHSARVVNVDEPHPSPIEADAAVTTVQGRFLAVMVADCVPVILADPVAGVVGVAHAGRRGMCLDIATATVQAMRDLGAQDIRAVLGPSVCARCYEVPEQLRADSGAVVPLAASITRDGTPALDIAAGVAGQLVAAGARVQILPGCTAEDSSLFSYRRDPATGRFIGLVGLG